MPDHGDIYLIGGGEDGPQALAAQRLIADGGLHRARRPGRRRASPSAPATSSSAPRSSPRAPSAPASELLDLSSDRGPTRAVGELAGDIDPELGLPPLTGFENHGGRTHLGPGVNPLARVTAGIGNDGQTEGAWHGKILGTYTHGPALARNPAIADLLLRWATGRHSWSRSTTPGRTGCARNAWPPSPSSARLRTLTDDSPRDRSVGSSAS